MVEKQAKVVQKIQEDIIKARLKLERNCYRVEYEEMERLEADMERLRNKMRAQKKKLDKQKKNIVQKADIVLGTLTGCGKNGSPVALLPKNHFQVCVIDECSQSQEMSCWLLIPKAPKLILAGDHHQLPPTILSKKAEEKLSLTLMERILDIYWYTVAKMLNIQYRMNSKIMDWSSTTFYHGKLYAAQTVANHKLSDLEHVTKSSLTDTVLLFIDTAGKGMTETKGSGKAAPSFANIGEASIVIHHVKSLINHGVKPEDIAIITPYILQVDLLSCNLQYEYPEIEIKSVDGFQGREKEVIILSLVRSNEAQNLGFLVEKRRLNVGVTRARRQLVLVCDSNTVTKDESIKKFTDYIKKYGNQQPPVNVANLTLPTALKKSKEKNQKIAKPTEKNKKREMGNKTQYSSKTSSTLEMVVGLDCEMVGTGENGKDSMLARVSIVDHKGKPLLDTFVAESEKVTDYRTKISGITAEKLRNAPSIKTVRKQVWELLNGKILVGHNLNSDMDALKLYFPRKMIRDTAKYKLFQKGWKTPSLKSLAFKHLNKTIQNGEHSSIVDAFTAVQLYLRYRREWEQGISKGQVVTNKSKRKKAKTRKRSTETKAESKPTIESTGTDGKKRLQDQRKIAETVEQKISKTCTADANIQIDRPSKSRKKNKKKSTQRNIYGEDSMLCETQKPAAQKKRENDLSEKLEKLSITKTQKVQQNLSYIERMKLLNPDHIFEKQDFPEAFWNRNRSRKGKIRLRIQWAEAWLEIRNNKKPYSKFNDRMCILDAFNKLSNSQLKHWIEKERKKLDDC